MKFTVERITEDCDVVIAKVTSLENACNAMQNDAFMNYPEDAELINWEGLICDVVDMLKMNNEFEMKLISVTYKVDIYED